MYAHLSSKTLQMTTILPAFVPRIWLRRFERAAPRSIYRPNKMTTLLTLFATVFLLNDLLLVKWRCFVSTISIVKIACNFFAKMISRAGNVGFKQKNCDARYSRAWSWIPFKTPFWNDFSHIYIILLNRRCAPNVRSSGSPRVAQLWRIRLRNDNVGGG